MGRKRKPLPFIENVTIEAVAAEGKCITRIDDQVIFVPFCVPGDVVDLQVVKKKHKYCEAKVVRFIKKSDVRQEPMCEHFGICGGCKWQNLPYEEQIKAKQKQVEDQLTRIGKIELPEFRPIMQRENSGVPKQDRIRMQQQAMVYCRGARTTSSERG